MIEAVMESGEIARHSSPTQLNSEAGLRVPIRRLLSAVPLDMLIAETQRRNLLDIQLASDEEIEAEARRRGYTVFRLDELHTLPGLSFDPTQGAVFWKGVETQLTRRESEVFGVLVAAYPRGVRGPKVAECVYGENDESTIASTRTYIRYLRVKLPGLIRTGGNGGPHLGYYLDLKE